MQPGMPEFVVLSLALSGNPKAQMCTIVNVLGHTEAQLVVHHSFTTGARIATDVAKTLFDSGRGHLNPHRVRVGRLAPGILLAHLSNFDYALKVIPTNSETRFVWLSSNTVIVRPGLEAWVLRHPLSFCVHSTCSDWTCTNEELLRGSCKSRIEERLAWPAEETRSTPLSTRIRTLAATQDDALVRNDTWLSHFVRYLNTHEDGFLNARPVGLLTHEGSWYPRHLLQEFRRALAGTPFEQTMLRYNTTGPRCPCCDLYGVGGNSLYSTKGACSFEELLLPTYVWQYHRDLLAHAAPALAMRIWQRPQTSRLLVRAMDATAKALFSGNALPHVFAVKIPHRHSPDIVAMFNETLTTFAPHDECLHSYAGSTTWPAWH
jgi:hypothetical protein